MEKNTFKIVRPIMSGIKSEVIELINIVAKKLDMYDDRFPESEQCGGYKRFKGLCLNKEILEADTENKKFNMSHFHPNIRQHVIKAVEVVRNLIKTKNYTVWQTEDTQ